MSSVLRLSCCAVVGLIQTALSQVILFCGLGQLLQPAVVGERSVPDGRIGPEHDLHALRLLWTGAAAGAFAVTLSAGSAVFGTTPSCSAFCQKMSKLPDLGLALPVFLDQIVSRFVGLSGQRRDHFVRGLAAVERRDQRLDEADGSVEAADIAPGFQIMRFRNVPDALARRFRPEKSPR